MTTEFPPTPSDFYALRDDRTNRCVGNYDYQRTSCAVYLAPDQAATCEGQTMLVAAANLLSRWCRRVTVALPRTAACSAIGAGDLGEVVVSQMRDADPFGAFHAIDIELAGTSDIALCIGTWSPIASGPTVFINSAGWLAAVSCRQPLVLSPSQTANRVGAIGAACLGVGQVFKIAVGMPVDLRLRDGIFDLSRLQWLQEEPLGWPDSLDVGKVLMVGAGSVGSATAYCARLIGLEGAIDIVDRDTIEVENFNRSPIFGRSTYDLAKAEAVSRFLGGCGLVATPLNEWWNEFVQRRRRATFEYDVWLPLANEFNVRHSMQHNLPPLMIHASTTANWGVNHGRHVPGRDECLAERFPTAAAPASMACATAHVEVASGVVDAALPFASVFAGLLVVADLVRAQLPEYPQVPNFALVDWYGELAVQAWNRDPHPDCPACRDQGRSFQERFNGLTKYWPLSRFRQE